MSAITKTEVEQLAFRYGNRTQNWPVIIDADELGFCMLEWSGACGGSWRVRWLAREDFLTLRALQLTDGAGKAVVA